VGQAFDQTKSDLFATRFVLGIFDAGLLPGSVFVSSLYYPAVYLQSRMAMIMIANISSNTTANILAYAIAHLSNTSSNKWHGWRWYVPFRSLAASMLIISRIFLVEGCLTFGISVVCCYSSIARPETAKFLTHEEKTIVARDVESRETTIGVATEFKIFFSNILNYIWAAALVFTASTTYSVALFAPSFVEAFHPKYTVPQVQGQVVPIFVVSAAGCAITAFLADRYQHRISFALGGYLFTTIGFAILRQSKLPAPSISMLGLYFVSMGTYVSMPMVWSLTLANLPSPFQKAIGVGFVIGIGNVGAFTSAWFFRSAEAPRYHSGMTNSLIFSVLAFALVTFAAIYIIVANKRSDKLVASAPIGGVDEDGQNVKSSGHVRRFHL
jgi:MFS family permease